MKKSNLTIVLVSGLILNSLTTHAHGQNIQPTKAYAQTQTVNQHQYPITNQHNTQSISSHQKYGNHSRAHGTPIKTYKREVNASHRFTRGNQLPVRYRGNSGKRYVVVDWHNHANLYEPPKNMRWSYIDGRYILATIATGIIYNIIYTN